MNMKMNSVESIRLILLVFCLLLGGLHGTELVFQLEAKDEMCFYEYIADNVKTIVEFQVKQ